MVMSTRPGNKTPRAGVVEKKAVRRKGKDGKTVQELDLEAKRAKKAEKEQKVRDLKRLEVEQAANLANQAAVTPGYPTKTLRGGKQVGVATTVKKPRKRRAVTSSKQPQPQAEVTGAEEGGAVNIGNNVQVGVPHYAGPGQLSGDPTQANPELVQHGTSTNSATLGKKRQRALLAIQDVVEVS